MVAARHAGAASCCLTGDSSIRLSQTRIAADVELPVGFSINDDTVTAIVSQPEAAGAPMQSVNGPYVLQKVGLPDGATGVFDPGWDTNLGTQYDGPTHTLKGILRLTGSARRSLRMPSCALHWAATGQRRPRMQRGNTSRTSRGVEFFIPGRASYR